MRGRECRKVFLNKTFCFQERIKDEFSYSNTQQSNILKEHQTPNQTKIITRTVCCKLTTQSSLSVSLFFKGGLSECSLGFFCRCCHVSRMRSDTVLIYFLLKEFLVVIISDIVLCCNVKKIK